MSESEKRIDQAENLRTKMMIDQYKEEFGNYPPRGEVHKHKAKRTKLKVKHPVISLLALFFVLLPIVILSLTLFYFDKGNSKTGKTSADEETVFISHRQDNSVSKTDAQEVDEAAGSSIQLNLENGIEYKETKIHQVTKGETLYSIAMEYYNSRSGEEIIREFNKLEDNAVYEGQVLKIPVY